MNGVAILSGFCLATANYCKRKKVVLHYIIPVLFSSWFGPKFSAVEGICKKEVLPQALPQKDRILKPLKKAMVMVT